MWVDSHCHLVFDGLRERIQPVRESMLRERVSAGLSICTTMEEAPAVLALAQAHPWLWCTVGVHPDQEEVHEPSVEELVAQAQLGASKVVAIGETGLDYFRLEGRSVAQMQWQRDRFRTHIRAALACRLPLVIHTRAAAEDTLAILQEEGASEVGGVFHCFTESAQVARQALDLGFYISFSGILTFKNAQDLRDVAQWVPLDRCLVETDSPYLAPVPHRGKPNEPAWVSHVGQQLAQIKGLSGEEMARITTQNFQKLFRVEINSSL